MFQPNTQEMKALLKEYDNHSIKMNGTGHREETRKIDELFKDIGFVYTREGVSYRIVYYVFSWNTSSVEGARHETRKIIVYDNNEYLKDYYLHIYPIKISIEGESHIIMINEDGGIYSLDFTNGLPEQINKSCSDVHKVLYDNYVKENHDELQDVKITRFAHIGEITVNHQEYHVVDLRTVINGMLSPRGNNYILIYDNKSKLIGKVYYSLAMPLWCEGSRVYLWDTETREGMYGNVWEFKDGIEEGKRKLIEIPTYGSYKSEDTLENTDNKAVEFYQKLRETDRADRFDSAFYSEEVRNYEDAFLLLAKKGILSNDYDDQDTAICVLFAIVEPDQMDPPKCYLISDLRERFFELYKINKQDNGVGIASEKFLYSCFEVGEKSL